MLLILQLQNTRLEWTATSPDEMFLKKNLVTKHFPHGGH